MQFADIALQFQIQGQPILVKAFGQGHINQTLKLETDSGQAYILQRINQYVFQQPEQLMENALAITAFLRKKADYPGETLHFVFTRSGTPCYRDDQGDCWRMYHFIPGIAVDRAENPEDFYRCGLAFGAFQRHLAEFPAEGLHETIPHFHNTVERYRQFHAAVQADPVGRLSEVRQEINFLLSLEERAGRLQQMLRLGQLPLRVTHNDTKINNLLFDGQGQPICILDLDTVMPGLSAMDFADAIRTGAATAAEDTPDIDKMTLDLMLFRAFTTGFLEGATTLTPNEVAVLAESVLVITLEQSTRFLKDYLEGDPYYKVAYPTHNLVRARAQIQLAKEIILKMDDMKKIILEIYNTLRKQSLC